MFVTFFYINLSIIDSQLCDQGMSSERNEMSAKQKTKKNQYDDSQHVGLTKKKKNEDIDPSQLL